MEYRIATLLMGIGRPKTESYVDTRVKKNTEGASVILAWIIAEVVFYILVGSLASYLSWSSNSTIGWHPAFSFVFAVISFFCAGSYLIIHLLFKFDLLTAIEVARRIQVPLVPPLS